MHQGRRSYRKKKTIWFDIKTVIATINEVLNKYQEKTELILSFFLRYL